MSRAKAAMAFLRAMPQSAALARPAIRALQPTARHVLPQVPAPVRFEDVTVLPSRGLLLNGQLADGGPVLPANTDRALACHRRDDRFIAIPPAPPQGAAPPRPRILRRPCLWGGYAVRHFGHLIGEQISRIPAALHHQPDAICLMVVRPEWIARTAPRLAVPNVLYDTLAWLGLDRDRVHLVTRQTQVSTLYVSPQAEYLDQSQPPGWYLDLLDDLTRRHGLPVGTGGIVYVTRLGMLRHASGANAGESYLVERLLAAGVKVLDPARARLNSQLAAYASARAIVFAEGSALHGRQLLGRLDQRVTVLRRRRNIDLAAPMIAPRVTGLDYVAATAESLVPVNRAGVLKTTNALGYYDIGAVHAAFADLGVDLSAGWSTAAYRAAVEADTQLWLTSVSRMRSGVDFAATQARIRPVLRRQGFEHLLGKAAPSIAPAPASHRHTEG